MPAIINSDDGVVSGSSGLKTSGANDGILALQNNGTTNVTVTAAGNVGIGTSSPSGASGVTLAINGGAGQTRLALKNTASGDTSGDGFQIVLLSDGVNVVYQNRESGYQAWENGGTERMRIDSSGNVGIGTSSVPTVGSTTVLAVGNANGGTQAIVQSGTIVYRTSASTSGVDCFNPNASPISWYTSGTERARIDSSGRLMLGTTTTSISSLDAKYFDAADGQRLFSSRGSTAFREHVIFQNPNGTVGTISTSGSATTYATSSDYRLKHDITPMTGALAKVAALKPVTYKWNADNSAGEGFIAHELAEVVPQCVTGEKDAVETYTDEEGNEQTRPKYQGIDTSFLVATLTAAIQELKAELDATKAEVAALKAAAK